MPASPTAARTATDAANGASPPPSPTPESPLAASREELNATLTYIRVTPNGRIAAAVGSGDARPETDPGWEAHKEQARQAREGQETSSTPTRSPGEATDPPAQLEAEPAAVAEGGPGAGTETGGEEARPPSGAAVEAGGADGTEPEGQAAVDGVGAGAAEPPQPEQEPAAQEAADKPAAEETVVEIDQPLVLTLTGTSIIVTYAGVASNSAYLLPGGIGMKKGPHPKAELQFQQEFPLVYFKDATTFKDFADKALGGRLELDARSLVGPIKVVTHGEAQSLGCLFMSKPEYMPPDNPLVVKPEAGAGGGKAITLLLAAEELFRARVSAGRSIFDRFTDGAQGKLGHPLTDKIIKTVFGHTATTIKVALGRSEKQKATRDCKVLSTVERICERHQKSNFAQLPVELAASAQASKRQRSSVNVDADFLAASDEDETGSQETGSRKVRKRTFLSLPVKCFIDTYLDTYNSLAGQPTARQRLREQIKTEAEASLGDEVRAVCLTTGPTGNIANRLHTAQTEAKAKKKAEEAAADGANH